MWYFYYSSLYWKFFHGPGQSWGARCFRCYSQCTNNIICYSPSVRLSGYTIARDSCMRLVGTRYCETKCAQLSAPTFCCHRPDPRWKLWKTSFLSQRASRQSVLVTFFQLTSSLLPSLSADHHCAASNCPTSSWASET